MFDIAFYSRKGGSGKSTLSAHFAAGLQHNKFKTVLLDLDPQGSNAALSDANPEGLPDVVVDNDGSALAATPAQWKEIVKQFDDLDCLVCEYPPGLPGAKLNDRHDLVIVPTQATRYDYISTIAGVDSLAPNTPFLVVVNRFKKQSPDQNQILEILRDRYGDDRVLIVPEAQSLQGCLNSATTLYTNKERLSGHVVARAAIDTIVNRVVALIKKGA